MKRLTILLFFCIGTPGVPMLFQTVSGQVRLPQLIGDHMVLQRGLPVNIWGWAAPGEKIEVRFAGRRYEAKAGGDSSWQVKLEAMKAGGPYDMDIRGSNDMTVKDILIGDLWFCSGQSNMVLNMERVKEKYPEGIAAADYPQIRNFFVPTLADVSRIHRDLPASAWVEASPNSVLGFGAATWFFAIQLYLKYHVPIGIINSSVGGTPIQAWISAEGLKDLRPYAERVARLKDTAYVDSLMHPSRGRRGGGAAGEGAGRSGGEAGGSPAYHPYPRTDRGLAGPVKWYDTSYTPVDWHRFWLPGYWADQGVRGLNGVVWFRKEIEVPASMAGKPAKLFVGRIVDADETYVNGVKVGNITYQYPPRRYVVPAGVLKAGKNLLVVRVTNTTGKGGFVPDKRYELTDGITRMDIRGDWQYKVGQVFPPRNYSGSGMPFQAQNEPAALYNTMVAPAVKEGIKGFLWYQGEANVGNPGDYHLLLPALITDWRSKWGEGELPFLYVQLPNFGEAQYLPGESGWAELREAELEALAIPNTGMAVTIDIGEWNDIHPLDKKDVGERLALGAEKIAYGERDLVWSGPIYRSATIAGDSIVLSFTNTGSGLMVKGSEGLHGFAIAGADKRFVWADARVEGDKVVVSSEDVPQPKFVRYAWADNPEDANFYNKEGLPASPFRTDPVQ